MSEFPVATNAGRRIGFITLLLLAAGWGLGQGGSIQGGCISSEDPAQPLPIVAPGCVEGELGASNRTSLFSLTLPAEGQEQLEASASLSSPARIEVCLLDAGQARLQCRTGDARASLVDLAPAAGDYFISLRQDSGQELPFRLELAPAPKRFSEAEPNDSVAQANRMEGGRATGRTVTDEWDYFSFDVEGEPQLWRFEVAGSGLDRLSYFDGSGRKVLERGASAGEVTMSNLFLLPGRHYLAVRGTDGEYELSVSQLGVPEQGSERESNDDETRALPLRPQEERSGALDASDVDFYRLSTFAPEYLRIELQPLGEAPVRLHVGQHDSQLHEPGQPIVYQAMLHPGDHYLRVSGNGSDPVDYRLLATTLDPLALPADLEPNDYDYQARLLPPDGTVTGSLGGVDYEDWYRLPPISESQELTVAVERSPRLTFYAIDGDRREQFASFRDAQGELKVELPASPDIRVQVQGSVPYRLQFDVTELGAQLPSAADLHLTFATDDTFVSAYWHEGQRVSGEVTVENRSSETVPVELLAASSHYGWRPVLDQSVFTLAAGESRVVPITIEVLPDARDDLLTRVTVQARVGENDRAGEVVESYFARTAHASGRSFAGTGPTATLSFDAQCGAPPVAPAALWALTDRLLGGVNLAWSGIGGKIADLDSGGSPPTLIDGLVAPSYGWQGNAGSFVTFELADSSLPVTGFILNPYAQGRVEERLARFEIQASDDGTTFTTVLQGRLGAEPVEQEFLLPAPLSARYLRLVALTNQSGARGRMTLGEFKAVTTEAARLFGERGADLANPATGGYLVWTKPASPPGNEVLAADSAPWEIYLDRGESTIEWAIGFHENRAARIAALEWVKGLGGGEHSLSNVEVAVSLDSPVGPWQELGTWDVAQQPLLDLADAPWARFVRLRAGALSEATTYRMPAAVRIFEQPVSGSYRTVLGEWGQSRRAAIYEALEAPAATIALADNDDNDSRERAQQVVPGEPVSGQVTIGEDVDWYRISVPEGKNSLELELSAEPVLGVRFELVDSNGEPLVFEERSGPSTVSLRAFVEPGDYFLKLDEPPRSVVFAWDNSGSMGPYLDIIYQTVSGFVRDVQPGREVAQLLAFEDDPQGVFLLPQWSDDPLELMSALNEYGRTAGSSNAEANLLASTRALGEREGTRAIMFMTDAESPGSDLNPELWTELERVRPRVFTFETSSAGSTHTQDLMQSWADVAGGHYDYARGVGDFEAGFARATCHLRRPAHYRLAVATEYREPPGPGQLSVVRQGGAGGNPPIEIVLDLSGSMSRALPSGPTRLEVARAVLDELIGEALPEGTPFALRAFGHVKPNSCDTRLEVPLGPLDRAAAQRAVAAAQPQLLSGTPLAASLLEVQRDLGSSGRGATVILLTDGEESCGGDVEAAVDALRSAGLEVRLHIISFDVTSDEAKTDFAEWARLGGGRYFDANDQAGLAGALQEALQPAFEVVDSQGSVVATGVVGGEPVSVPPGIYALRLAGSAENAFVGVRVRGDDSQELVLGAGGE